MTIIIQALIAALPTVLFRIFSKVLTESVLQRALETVIIWGLRKLTPLTTNTLDDEIAEEIIKALQQHTEPPK